MSAESKPPVPDSNSEPKSSPSTVPMWIFALTLTLGYLVAVYFDHHSGWFDSRVYPPYGDANQLEAYQPKSGAAALAAHGKQVYEQVCGICHGTDGLGKAGQAPPLAGSEWVVAKGYSRLAHVPLMGLAGDLKVEGKDWNMAMAAMGAGLSDSDLAAVLTYVRTSWGNHADPLTADDITKVRAAVGKNATVMPADQFEKMPE